MSTEGNNGGIYSKFQERLRKIRLSRMRKKKQNDKFVKDKVDEIKEVLNYNNNINYKIKKGYYEEKGDKVSDVLVNIKTTDTKDNVYVTDDSIKEKIINIRENKPKIRKNKRVSFDYKFKKNNIKDLSKKEREEFLSNLGTDIIDKIKTSFEDKLDELEVLYSELYLLNQQNNNELELKKVNELKKRINLLLERVNVIIEQYNLYKKNYYIDNVIGIDDNILVDDIINYRNLLNSLENEKKFVKEYKALEEFKKLYNNLKEVRDETEKLVHSNASKIEKYEIRDKKYDNIKLNMVEISDTYKKCSIEIEKQNKYFNELMSKVMVINSEEYITKHLRGIGELVGQSLKYMGLMILSPLASLVPNIALQTIATKKMISNIYKHIHTEEIRHIHYEAINYDNEINQHLNDVDYVDNLIEDTLSDVERLKEDFMRIYNSNIPGYDDTLKNIQKIENKLYHNQNRISIVKNNLKQSKKLNEDKLRRVRELNNN